MFCFAATADGTAAARHPFGDIVLIQRVGVDRLKLFKTAFLEITCRVHSFQVQAIDVLCRACRTKNLDRFRLPVMFGDLFHGFAITIGVC